MQYCEIPHTHTPSPNDARTTRIKKNIKMSNGLFILHYIKSTLNTAHIFHKLYIYIMFCHEVTMLRCNNIVYSIKYLLCPMDVDWTKPIGQNLFPMEIFCWLTAMYGAIDPFICVRMWYNNLMLKIFRWNLFNCKMFEEHQLNWLNKIYLSNIENAKQIPCRRHQNVRINVKKK